MKRVVALNEDLLLLGLTESLGAITNADINLLKRYRPEIEIELATKDKRDQLFRNLEKSFSRKQGAPVLDLPDTPSLLLLLVDRVVAGHSITPTQEDKLKRTAQALRKYAADVQAAEKEDEKLPF
jgi:hypothetical protein